ncbi:MAG: hypothetical protein ACJ0BK_06680 [Coraliomargaritaceae bacterium]
MKNKTLPTFWILGILLCMAYGFGYGLDASVEARKLLSFSGIILTLVFAILMMVRVWKLDICKTTVKIWLLGGASLFASGFFEAYSMLLTAGGQLTCLACLIRASYLLYTTPDIATP